MAVALKPRSEEQYGRLMGMIAPEATPSKRIGTEAPVGSVAAGPKAGQAASEFTKAGQAPGAAFSRQLKGADISGITRLSEQPLLREAGQEATRVAQEGIGYKAGQQKYLSEQPQFKFGQAETPDLVKKLGEGEAGATETAQKVLAREKIDVPEFTTADIKEFTPLQALRGGSVESLLKKEATGPYSTGMAGLDALLFQKKGGAADLATKGIALRTAEQATADALEKKLTEEARKEAGEFVTGQKEQLSGAIKGDIEAKTKKYTEPKDKQPSALEAAQRKLASETYAGRTGAMTEASNFIKQEQNQVNNALIQEAASRLFPDDVNQFLGIVAVMNDPAKMQAIQNDPTYKQRKEKADQEIISKISALRPEQFVTTPETPTLGLANVMSAEDAAAYNRLQGLVGGQGLEAKTIAAPKSTFDQEKVRQIISDYIKNSGLFTSPQQQPVVLGSGNYNIPFSFPSF